jgi:glycerol-3-phosphate O-acyltransferase/dihydroxyacetone phosphate acyltransferase
MLLVIVRVNRPQDHAVNGEGRIKSIDSCHITGINTKFTKQLDKNDYISFPKGYGEFKVVNIISDIECIVDLDTESSDPEKLSALLKDSNNRIEYRCMPHIEQAAVYKKVHAELNRNSTIGIFPEGGSHDRTQLLPLKGGVTAMAMGAMAKYNGLDVKIVPCGKYIDVILCS